MGCEVAKIVGRGLWRKGVNKWRAELISWGRKEHGPEKAEEA